MVSNEKKSTCFVLLSVFLLIIGILFVVFGSMKHEHDVSKVSDVRQLGVVVDAGGSGTRVKVYERRGDSVKQLNADDDECDDDGLTKYETSTQLTNLRYIGRTYYTVVDD